MRKLRPYLILMLLTLLTTFYGCKEKEDLIPSITITGKVVDKETGSPIEDCEVKLNSEQIVSTKSDGSFSITNGEGKGNYTLTFSANGYVSSEITKNVTNQSKLDFGTVQLEAALVTITGKVVDKETGNPIEDCEVQLDSLQIARTKSDGSFSIVNAEATGSYTLTFKANGYANKTETKTITSQSELDFGTIQLEATVVTLKGVVTDKESGDAIEGARIQLGSEKFATTGADGRFTLLTETVRESYTISLHTVGYRNKFEIRQASAQKVIDFGMIQIESSNTVSELKTIIINGKTVYVLPADVGGLMTWSQAVSSAEHLSAFGFSEWRLPSEDELNQIYLKKDDIGGFYNDYYWSSQYKECQHLGTGTQSSYLKSGRARFVMDDPIFSYEITLINKNTEATISNAKIIVETDENKEYITDSFGKATLTLNRYINNVFTISSDGYFGERIELVTNSPSEPTTIKLTQKRYTFSIVDESHLPVAGVKVNIYSDDDVNTYVNSTTSDEFGKVIFEGKPNYYITVEKSGYYFSPLTCADILANNSKIRLIGKQIIDGFEDLSEYSDYSSHYITLNNGIWSNAGTGGRSCSMYITARVNGELSLRYKTSFQDHSYCPQPYFTIYIYPEDGSDGKNVLRVYEDIDFSEFKFMVNKGERIRMIASSCCSGGAINIKDIFITPKLNY